VFNRRFASHLKRLLDSAGLSVPEFADRIGKSQPTVYLYLRGTRLPPLDDLEAMANALGLDHAGSLLPPTT